MFQSSTGTLPVMASTEWSRYGCCIHVQTKEVTRLNSIYGNILKNNNVEQIEGKAYIKDEHTVQVLHPESGEVLRELTTKNILIAVGGGPARLNIPGGEHTITSDEALSLPEQPKRIAIIGAGYIAVEFAGIFAGFGSEVHLFFRKDLPLTSTTPLLLVSVSASGCRFTVVLQSCSRNTHAAARCMAPA